MHRGPVHAPLPPSTFHRDEFHGRASHYQNSTPDARPVGFYVNNDSYSTGGRSGSARRSMSRSRPNRAVGDYPGFREHGKWTVNAGRRCQPSHCWRQPLQVLSAGLSCGYWKTLSLGDSLNVTPHWSHFVELILRCQSGTSQRRWLVGLSCSVCVDHGKAVVKCKKPWPEWSVFTSSN